MYVHNINPTIFSIFGLDVRWYGVAYVVGFLLTLWWLMKFRNELSMSKDDVYDFIFYGMIGIVLGARFFHVFVWEPSYYLANPLKVFYLWQGGMSFHGGLVGLLAAGWMYSKKKKLPFWKLADILSVPAFFGLAIGRVANFVNAELYGPVTSLPWGVDFGDGEFRHPYQLYSSLKQFVLSGFLAWVLLTKSFKQGFVFWLMISLMGFGRFFLDFLREDTFYYLGLSVGQWMSLVMGLVGTYVLLTKYKEDLRKLFKHK
jgi:phosphatidylglycerol---prolipoprotein diacylglyceryl transferase